MRASQLIEILQRLMDESQGDPEVLAQSSGCCKHGHDIVSVDTGAEFYDGVHTGEEVGAVVIRV